MWIDSVISSLIQREVTDSSSVVSTKKLLEPQWFWEFLFLLSTQFVSNV